MYFVKNMQMRYNDNLLTRHNPLFVVVVVGSCFLFVCLFVFDGQVSFFLFLNVFYRNIKHAH